MKNEIKNIVFGDPLSHVAIITSKKGTIRSNHYHKTHGHILYIIEGAMQYSERDLDGSNKWTKIIKPGEQIKTPPNKVHKTRFLKDTTLINISFYFSSEEYDQDTVKEIF